MRLTAAVLWAAVCTGSAAAHEAWHDDVDYTKLKNILRLSLDANDLGPKLPSGAGVAISLVEATDTSSPSTGNYFVDQNYVLATLPEFTGTIIEYDVPVALTNATNPNRSTSSLHANRVASRFFGDASSVAPGANAVTVHEANNWMSSVLKYDTTPLTASPPPPGPPIDLHFRVQNHSWAGSFAEAPNNFAWQEDPRNVDVLRRLDWLIERANDGQGMIVAVGLQNSSSTPIPYLLAHSYNAIAVGKSNGDHSSGLTRDLVSSPNYPYGPGRSKPDIVGPRASPTANYFTSFSTAMVSSTATMLYSAVQDTDAMNSEVIKAMLMAGATKHDLPSWSHTNSLPLDDTFGAGELNVYNSYLMTVGGRRQGTVDFGSMDPPTASVATSGWDYQNFKGNATVGDVYYNFEIPTGSTAQELSIILAWNVEVTDTSGTPEDSSFAPVESLQNLDLTFYDSSTSFLGTVLHESNSMVDNVEHIYRNTQLGPGTYTLKVSGAADWDYGLAWRMTTEFDVPSADFDENGVVDGADFLTWQRNVGLLVGATRADGDANGDGTVDGSDLTLIQEASSSPPQLGAGTPGGAGSLGGASGSIPEPTAACLAALATLILGFARRVARS